MRLMVESLPWSFLPGHFTSPCAAPGPPDLGTTAAKSSRNDRGAAGLAFHLGEEVAGRESGPARGADTRSPVSWCRGSGVVRCGAVRLLDGSSSITLGLAGGDQEWLSESRDIIGQGQCDLDRRFSESLITFVWSPRDRVEREHSNSPRQLGTRWAPTPVPSHPLLQ